MHAHAHTQICTYSQKYFIEHTLSHCAYARVSGIHYNTRCICIWYTHTHSHEFAHTLEHAPEHTQIHIARACVFQNTLYQRVAVCDTSTRTHINLHICRYSQNHSTEHIHTHCAYVRLSKSQKYNITRGVFLWDIHARMHIKLNIPSDSQPSIHEYTVRVRVFLDNTP